MLRGATPSALGDGFQNKMMLLLTRDLPFFKLDMVGHD